MIDMLRQASILALLSVVLAVLPLGAGIAYAIRPTEQRLALLRPLSLAGIFSGLTGLAAGGISLLRFFAVSETPVQPRLLALGLAEALVPLFVAFGCLTIGWLCAAIGLRRHP